MSKNAVLHDRFGDIIAIKLRPKESCRQSANVLQKSNALKNHQNNGKIFRKYLKKNFKITRWKKMLLHLNLKTLK